MTTLSGVPAGTSAAAFLYADFPLEHASTRRMLERFPNQHASWRPHERSRTLAELATHVADIPNRGTMVLTNDSVDVMQRQPVAPVADVEALLAHFDAARGQLDAALAIADFATLEEPFTMRRGDQVLVSSPRRLLLRTMVASHLGHHRAQLGLYYRMLGVPVPGMYGPSADEAR